MARNKTRSHSVPSNFRPCREVKIVKAAPLPSNTEENAGDQLGQLPGFPPLDDAFEPFLTPEMVATERAWRREVIGLLALRNVPARPHSCRNSCPACCQLYNNTWRLQLAIQYGFQGTLIPAKL